MLETAEGVHAVGEGEKGVPPGVPPGGKPFGKGGKGGKGSGPYSAAPPPYGHVPSQPAVTARPAPAGLPPLDASPGVLDTTGRRTPQLPTGWTEAQLTAHTVDFDVAESWITHCPDLRGPLAEVRPDKPCTGSLSNITDQASGGQPTLRLGRPNRERRDNCAFCHNRPLPAPNTPESNRTHPGNWRYGTGDGNHSPYQCMCLKAFLAAGGDDAFRAKYPWASPYLRKMCVPSLPRRGPQ